MRGKRKSNGEFEFYEPQAMICKAFANPTRLQLVEMLMERGCWAAEWQEGSGISKANLSQHLAVLKSAGFGLDPARGKAAALRVGSPEVKQAKGVLRSILRSQVKESRRWSYAAGGRLRRGPSSFFSVTH